MVRNILLSLRLKYERLGEILDPSHLMHLSIYQKQVQIYVILQNIPNIRSNLSNN